MTKNKHSTKNIYISAVMVAMLLSMPYSVTILYAVESESPTILENNPSIETIDTVTKVDEESESKAILENNSSTEIIPTVTQINEEGTPGQITITTDSQNIDSIPTIESNDPITSSTTILFEDTLPLFNNSTTTDNEISEASTLEDSTSTETVLLPAVTTTITTGVSIATANVLTIANTNLINSTGSVTLLNVFGNQSTDIDLREEVASTTPCTLLSCNGIDAITAKITSESSIINEISLSATSGYNEITTASSAIITTGNVYAGLNLVNIANTTLVDSHYVLLSLNSFGNMYGDIIFPSLTSYFTSSSSTMPSPDSGNVTTDSNAAIINNLNVGAISGDNLLESSSEDIYTGTTNTSLNVYNNTNSTLLGGDTLLLLLKVTGTWFGSLVGVPTGLDFNNNGSTYLLQAKEDRPLESFVTSTLDSTSTAFLSNTVSILAHSGNNIATNTNTSIITTGNAYASANIINIANTHIIGRNWILAMITIFGDFTGDIAFGRPDLWIGEEVSGEAVITNDTELLYTITIINKGDTGTTDVSVTTAYDISHLDIIDSSIAYTVDSNNHLIFLLGDMKPDESHKITFHAKVKETSPGTSIINTVTVQGAEKDNNILDNTDTTTITTTVPALSSGGSYHYVDLVPPTLLISEQTNFLLVKQTQLDTLQNITVIRTSTSTDAKDGVPVTQTIIIKNSTNEIIPAILFNDFLVNEHGIKIKTESWNIGNLLPNEEVTLAYSLSFGSQAGGVYTLSSEVLGEHSQNIYFANNGLVTYVPKLKSVLQVIKPTTNLTTYIPISLIVTSQTKKNIVRFIQKNNFIETAYAESGDTKNSSNSSFQYVILFAVFSILRLFRKQPNEHSNK